MADIIRHPLSAADEIKARRIYFPALAAFRSNLLDAADLSAACREELLALLRKVEASAPTSESWDAAMAKFGSELASVAVEQRLSAPRAML